LHDVLGKKKVCAKIRPEHSYSENRDEGRTF